MSIKLLSETGLTELITKVKSWTQSAIDELAEDIDGLADVATSGSYNDLSDTPTIPSAVTESTVSGWGFTKNTGTVSSLSDLSISATATELNYCDGVTSNIQTQLSGKAASSHTHGAGDITSGTLAVARGGTGQTTLALARNAMGLGNTTGAVPVANGGTGQTTIAAARNAFGLGNTTGAVPVANGGTGATTAASAQTNLGVSAQGQLHVYANSTSGSKTAYYIRTSSTDAGAASYITFVI